MAGSWTVGGPSAGDDVYVGDATNETVSGLGGNDVLIGGGGDDRLDGGAGTDTASYAGATLGVTVSLSAVGGQNTVGAGTDTLVSIENLTGSAHDDVLTGSSAGQVTLISTDSAGGQATDTLRYWGSVQPVFSPDGSKVAFSSSANNLVAGDTNDFRDIFVKDLSTGVVTRVSTTSTGGQATSSTIYGSIQPVFSPDGTKIAFISFADNLVAGDTNGSPDIFIKDLVTGAVTSASTNSDGQFVYSSTGPVSLVFSPDGTKIALASYAALVPDDTNFSSDIFIKDLATGAMTRVSTSSTGGQATGGFGSGRQVFSPDGTKIAFLSYDTNLVPGGVGGTGSIYVKDLSTGATTRVSLSTASVEVNDVSADFAFSPDWTKVVFSTYAQNLVAGDTNSYSDVFIKDLLTGEVTQVSTGKAGAVSNGYSQNAKFSPDGSKIGFWSNANNLADGISSPGLFVKDLSTGVVTKVLSSTNPPDNWTFSPDGTKVVFAGGESFPGDTNAMPDIFIVDIVSTGTNVLSGGDGNDTLTGLGGADTLDGGAGNDLLLGDDADVATADGADILTGGDGNDVLIGGQGADTLSGGAGDDILIDGVASGGIDAAGVAYLKLRYNVDGGGDVIDGGAGKDRAYLNYSGQTASVVFSNANSDALNVVTVGGVAAGSVTRVERIVFTGGSGADTITGGAGDDVLQGQGGADALDGGGGVDTVDYIDRYNAPVVVTLNGGSWVTVTVGGVAEDTLRSVENVTGSFMGADRLTGDGLDNVLLGLGGDDLLAGGGGDDLLEGGAGNDGLDGGAGNDTVSYLSDGAGVVVSLAETGLQDTVGSGGDILTSIENLLGSNFSDVLEGDGGANRLDGRGGDDVLFGGEGSDTLSGGAGADILVGEGGNDTMAGGLGDDAYWVDNTGDIVTELAAEGFDTVASAVSYTLSANVEQLILVGGAANATGNNDANMLIGNAANNILTGLDGNDVMVGNGGLDTMIGGRGDDAYWVGSTTDVITELAGEGYDSVAAFVSYTLSANLEQLVLLGAAANGIGNASANVITGNELSNVLDGQAGADRLVGGLGDDAYWVDNVGDVVVELAGEGFDTIASFVSYTLSANIEQLKLVGTVALTATGSASANILNGNDLDNTLYGLGGDDVLAGEAGADTMIGGIGNDAYWVDNIGDVIVENAGEGFESVASSVSYTLSANLEQLVLLGTAVSATGNAQANILIGNGLDNTITGAGGDDILSGGAGADTFVFGPGTGHDRVTDFGLGGAHDVLNLSAYTGTGVTWTVTQQGGNTLVAMTNGDSILLDGVLASHVTTQGSSLIWN